MLLVSGATTTLRPYILERPDVFGTLVVPRDGNALPEVGKWAADNGAFVAFDEVAFLALLQRHRYARERCLFVVAPDVVGDHAATLKRFLAWGPRLVDDGWPVAFVAQDGCGPGDVPWEGLAAVFIGGRHAKGASPLEREPYKLGPAAAGVAAEAHARGLWVHMGRVSSLRRVQYAAAIGVDSVDSSGFSKYPKAMLARHGRLLRDLSEQRRLVLQQLGEERP